MPKNGLLVQRYRYNAAQVLAEILRDEINSSCEEADDDAVDSSFESDDDKIAVDVADEFCRERRL